MTNARARTAAIACALVLGATFAWAEGRIASPRLPVQSDGRDALVRAQSRIRAALAADARSGSLATRILQVTNMPDPALRARALARLAPTLDEIRRDAALRAGLDLDGLRTSISALRPMSLSRVTARPAGSPIATTVLVPTDVATREIRTDCPDTGNAARFDGAAVDLVAAASIAGHDCHGIEGRASMATPIPAGTTKAVVSFEGTVSLDVSAATFGLFAIARASWGLAWEGQGDLGVPDGGLEVPGRASSAPAPPPIRSCTLASIDAVALWSVASVADAHEDADLEAGEAHCTVPIPPGFGPALVLAPFASASAETDQEGVAVARAKVAPQRLVVTFYR